MDVHGTDKTAIKLERLCIGYKGRAIFGPFDLDIARGSFNVLVGANGSGKSTLLNTIGGNLAPISGNIAVDGVDIGRLSHRCLARKLSFVNAEPPQGGTGLTVRELVEMGRYPYTGIMCRLSDTDRDIVSKSMTEVGIANKADCRLSDISDGERQKAMIARVLAQQTPVIMLDEPTNFLDAASRIEILALVKRLVEQKNITAVISSHDISTALQLADNVITLLPDDPEVVMIHPVGSEGANERLDAVFARRGIHFDPLRRDFVLNT